MNITQALDAFFASQAGQFALWSRAPANLSWVLGILAAVRDGTFQLDSVAAFLRKHVAGRIVPIWVSRPVGHFADSWLLPVIDVPALTTIGIGAAGLYVLETAEASCALGSGGSRRQSADALGA